MIQQERMKVVRHKKIAENIYEMTCIGQIVAQMKEPGQFVHVRVSDTMEPLLRRPISISSIDHETLQFTMIYRAEGRGTSLLAQKQVGEEIDVLGPLGHGFPVPTSSGEISTAVLIGGGIGVPPLYELSKRLNEQGVKTIHILGFQSADVVFYEEQFQALGETIICTVDGSKGVKGFVTDALKTIESYDRYYACGPTPMLRALQTTVSDVPGYLSFEERMGCGLGACFACVCDTTDNVEKAYVKVCSDGPVFPAGVVKL